MRKQSLETVLIMTMAASLSAFGCSKPAPTTDATAAPPAAPAATEATTTTTETTPPAADTTDPPDQTATETPPAPQVENPGPPPTTGAIWSGGSWQFQQGKFVWGKGHWEPHHDGQFEQPRWIRVNGRWEHHAGHWIVLRPGEHPGEPHVVLVPPHPGEYIRLSRVRASVVDNSHHLANLMTLP